MAYRTGYVNYQDETDYESELVLADRHQMALRDHQCDICKEPIRRGEVYRYTFTKPETVQPYTRREHLTHNYEGEA